MSDAQRENSEIEVFDLEIFNVSGEVQHTEINFDNNFDILEKDVDGARRC
jgi:hypothetical protein